MTFLIVEPTRKSLGVYHQYTEYARNYDVQLRVIANKIETQDDLDFVRRQVGDDLIAWVWRSDYVRAMEKGDRLHFSQLEAHNLSALETMRLAVDDCQQDWDRFYRQTVEFHRKNALAWINASIGEDVTQQIDPDFSLRTSLHLQPEVLIHS